MRNPRTLFFALLLCLLPLVSRSAPRPEEEPTALTVAVADLSGTDRELGRFLTETLCNDLSQSDRLRIMERAEVRQAAAELQLAADDTLEPPQVRRLGRYLRADRLLVGSVLAREDRLLLNARLLDARTGRLTPGGAISLAGDRADPISLIHRLALHLHRRMTGRALALDTDGNAVPAEEEADPADAPRPAPASNDLDPLRQSGLIPAQARAGSPVTERALAGLLRQVGQRLGSPRRPSLTLTQPSAPVTRLRALAALVKLAVSADELASYREAPNEEIAPDAAQIPIWGRPFVAAAVGQGWWPEDRPLRARETATWGFVGSLLARMPLADDAPESSPFLPASEPEPVNYTGLVIDARDLPIQRAMSPRILDEEGNVVYPDPKHLPDFDFLQDKGMAAYAASEQETKRAGSHPLCVRAVDVFGPGPDDLVVSNETAQQIRAANRRSKFLWRWSVCILTAR